MTLSGLGETLRFPDPLIPSSLATWRIAAFLPFTVGLAGISFFPQRWRDNERFFRILLFLAAVITGWIGLRLEVKHVIESAFYSVLPVLLGLAGGMLLTADPRKRQGRIGWLVLGGALGVMAQPLLYDRLLGAAPTVQGRAVLLLAALIWPVKDIFAAAQGMDEYRTFSAYPVSGFIARIFRILRKPGMPVAVALYLSLLHHLLVDRFEACCFDGLPLSGRALACTLSGFAAGLALRGRIRWLRDRGHGADFLVLFGVAVILPCLAEWPSSSESGDLLRTVPAFFSFGVIAGLSTAGAQLIPRTDHVTSRWALPLFAAGLAPAFLVARRVLYHPAGSGRLLIIALTVLAVIEVLRPGSGWRSRTVRTVVAAAGLAGILAFHDDPWLSDDVPEILRIQGPNTAIESVISEPEPAPDARDEAALPRLPSFRIRGRDPFAASDGPTQFERMAYLTPLFHPHPRKAVVLGPDGGWFPLVLARDPVVKRITWINPVTELTDLVKRFVNLGPERGVTIRESTGRAFLREGVQEGAGEDAPDLIVVPPSPLERFRRTRLDTLEACIEARKLLAPDGVLCHWFFPHRSAPDLFASRIATLSRVFPHLYLYMDHPFGRAPAVALVAAKTRTRLTDGHLRKRMRAMGRLEYFESMGLGPEYLALAFVSAKEMLDIKVPLTLRRDGRATRHYPYPAEDLFNLRKNLRFLLGVKVNAYPLYSGDLPVDEGVRRCRALNRVTEVLLFGAERKLDRRWTRRAFNPAEGGALDPREASVLLKALAIMPENRWLLGMLEARIGALEAEEGGDPKIRARRITTFRTACLAAAPGWIEMRLALSADAVDRGDLDPAEALLWTAPVTVRKDRRFAAAMAIIEARRGRWKRSRLLLEILLMGIPFDDPELPGYVSVLGLLRGLPPVPLSGATEFEERWVIPFLKRALSERRGP